MESIDTKQNKVSEMRKSGDYRGFMASMAGILTAIALGIAGHKALEGKDAQDEKESLKDQISFITNEMHLVEANIYEMTKDPNYRPAPGEDIIKNLKDLQEERDRLYAELEQLEETN